MKYENLRYNHVIILATLAVLLLIIMWPALPATIVVTLLIGFSDKAFEKNENYVVNETEDYRYTKASFLTGMFLVTIFLGIILGMRAQNFTTPYLDEMYSVLGGSISNVLKGNIIANFKIYMTNNYLLMIVYIIVSLFGASVTHFMLEHDEKKRKEYKEQPDKGTVRPTNDYIALPKKPLENNINAIDNIKISREKFIRNRSSAFQIFLVRPRLLILLTLNYFSFWYNADYPIVENIIVAIIYIAFIAISLSGVAEWFFRLLEDVRHVATSTEKERLLELFENVKSRAMEYSKMIDSKVKLYIVDSVSVNALDQCQ